jgi:hypothetical protein
MCMSAKSFFLVIMIWCPVVCYISFLFFVTSVPNVLSVYAIIKLHPLLVLHQILTRWSSQSVSFFFIWLTSFSALCFIFVTICAADYLFIFCNFKSCMLSMGVLSSSLSDWIIPLRLELSSCNFLAVNDYCFMLT